MARLEEFESPTCRLGGGRSILLSYRRMCSIILSDFLSCVKNPHQSRGIFSCLAHIMGISAFTGGKHMETNEVQNGDVDDLIFAEEEYHPSDR